MILLLLATGLAFMGNAVSPNGIALMGQWNTSSGVINAKAKNGPVVHELEIDDIAVAKRIFDAGQAVFVDARHPGIYAEGHIQGAIIMPVFLFEEKIGDFKQAFPTSTYLITYCSGRECEDSHELAQLLFEQGYERINVFIDGFPEWQSHGYPTSINE